MGTVSVKQGSFHRCSKRLWAFMLVTTSSSVLFARSLAFSRLFNPVFRLSNPRASVYPLFTFQFMERSQETFAPRLGRALQCCGRGNCPPKAVSEPPPGAKCKSLPFRFRAFYKKVPNISLCSGFHLVAAVFYLPGPCFLSKILPPFELYKLPTLADLRRLLVTSVEAELFCRSQLCPRSWTEDSIIFSV